MAEESKEMADQSGSLHLRRDVFPCYLLNLQPAEKASDPNLTAKSSIFSDKIMDIKSAILQELEAH